jgi:hypothetical protein
VPLGFIPTRGKLFKGDLRGLGTGEPIQFAHEIILVAARLRLVSRVKRAAKLLAAALRKDIINARCF